MLKPIFKILAGVSSNWTLGKTTQCKVGLYQNIENEQVPRKVSYFIINLIKFIGKLNYKHLINTEI